MYGAPLTTKTRLLSSSFSFTPFPSTPFFSDEAGRGGRVYLTVFGQVEGEKEEGRKGKGKKKGKKKKKEGRGNHFRRSPIKTTASPSLSPPPPSTSVRSCMTSISTFFLVGECLLTVLRTAQARPVRPAS